LRTLLTLLVLLVLLVLVLVQACIGAQENIHFSSAAPKQIPTNGTIGAQEVQAIQN
jgi:hypothetical protein